MKVALIAMMIGGCASLSSLSSQDRPAGKSDKNVAIRQQGTDTTPLFVKLVPTPDTNEEAYNKKVDREERRDADIALIVIGAAQVVIFAFQLFVFGRQATRLRETVEAMGRQEKLTVAVVGAAEIQSKATAETLTHLQTSSQRELRAYVHVEMVRIEFPMQNVPGKGIIPLPIVASIRIRNKGRTPAYDVVTRGDVCAVFDGPVPKELPQFAVHGEQAKDVLGPEVDSTSPATMEQALSIKDQNAVMAGDAPLFIYGSTTYRDVYGHSCWTTYRYRFVPPVALDHHGEATACAEGNDADREPTA